MRTTFELAAPKIDRGSCGNLPATLEWVGAGDGYLRILDQTRLPGEVVFRDCHTVEDVWDAIRVLSVRGAPAIGVAAAYGLCLGTRARAEEDEPAFLEHVATVAAYLRACRPTAVNLAWAVGRIVHAAERPADDPAARWQAMLAKAHDLAVQDAETCRKIGEHGVGLIQQDAGILTHCNAGALATVAHGTALAPLYLAHARGRRFQVFADETRPLLQGARLTAWELTQAGIPVTLLCDNAAASLMNSGRLQLIIVGADRIAANGDTANKVGTYSVALAARHHGIPFYVAAPRSTFDRTLATGREIPIELRGDDELRGGPVGVPCYNPAFDVTPAELIAGIITEVGIVRPVSATAIAAIFQNEP